MRTRDAGSARNYVLRLIKFRPRSCLEVHQKLKLKGYASDIIGETISYFKNIGLLNDAGFARAWMRNRLSKPLGLKVIELELKQKGIDEGIIKELVKEARDSLDETKIVNTLARQRLDKLLKNKEPPEKLRYKLCNFLLRRGFSCDIVNDAVEGLIKG